MTPRRPFGSLVAAGALLLLGLAGAARAEPAQPSPLAVSGEALYVRHCAVCHGRSGTGNGPFRGVLTVAPSDLTRIAERRGGGSFPRDEIAAYVDGRFVPPAHGTREMPVWGRWLGQSLGPGVERDDAARGEILAILSYLETLQQPAEADGD